MKLNRHEFLTALIRACSVIDKRNAMEITRYVLARPTDTGLDVIGTNLRTAICTPVKVENPQGFLANAEDLRGYVAKLDGDEVTVTVDEKRIRVSAGSSNSELPTLPDRDFPAVPTFAMDGAVEVDASELRRAIDGTVYAAYADPLKPHLHGVYLSCTGTPEVAALNGPEASIRICNLTGLIGNVLIELGASNAIVKMLDGAEKCQVLIGKEVIFVGIDGAILASKTPEVVYPLYRNALIFANDPCTLSKDALLGAIERLAMVRAVSNSDNLECDIVLSNGSVFMSRTNGDASASEVVKGKGGWNVKVQLSLRLIGNAVANIDADEIELHVVGELNPVTVCDKSRRQIGFLMPIAPDNKKDGKNAVK